MDDEDQASARAIANGVQAWKKLTHRRVPATKEPTTQSSDKRWVPPEDKVSGYEEEDIMRSSVSTIPSIALKENKRCPFSSSSSDPLPNHPSIILPDPSVQRPESLPTPPEPHEDPLRDPIAPSVKPAPSSSPPPSATGSASKCPIRFLDHYSPEEVAEYFENHKHEIPRSHELCVKRYQSNAESIRQLDAKYGNLVSMIQGLGMKHQSLLPTTGHQEQEQEQNDHASQEKIERWANDVGEVPTGEALAGTGPTAEGDAQADMVEKGEEDEREGRFERPLKEIRVGESPSRPWGISIPLAADMHPTAVNALHGLGEKDHEKGKEDEKMEEPSSMSPLLPDPQLPRQEGKSMVFTGPVFFGYSTEQAAVLIQRLTQGAKGQ